MGQGDLPRIAVIRKTVDAAAVLKYDIKVKSFYYNKEASFWLTNEIITR